MFFLLLIAAFFYLVCPFCLQDIVENEDIKLDKMFIASLVNDLIKVRLTLQFVLSSNKILNYTKSL